MNSYVKPGDTGLAIIASGTTCNLSMDWSYEYNTWIFPVEISDKGHASVQVHVSFLIRVVFIGFELVVFASFFLAYREV